MSYSCSVTSKPSEIICTIFANKMKKNSRRKCTYPLPGTHVLKRPKLVPYSCSATSKTPTAIIFAVFYNKMNKNFRIRSAYPPSSVPGVSGIEADVIFVFGDHKNYFRKIILTNRGLSQSFYHIVVIK